MSSDADKTAPGGDNADVTTTDSTVPVSTDVSVGPTCFVKVIFENLEVLEQERTTGCIMLSDLYDVPTRKLRLGGFPTIQQHILSLAADELETIAPAQYFTTEQKRAYRTYHESLRLNWECGGKHSSTPARNGFARLEMYLMGLQLVNGVEVILRIRHPDPVVATIRTYYCPPTPQPTLPPLPAYPQANYVPVPDPGDLEVQPPAPNVSDSAAAAPSGVSDPGTAQPDQQAAADPVVPDLLDTAQPGSATAADNSASLHPPGPVVGIDPTGSTPDPINGTADSSSPNVSPPAPKQLFAGADMSGVSPGKTIHGPSYFNSGTPASDDSSTSHDEPPDEMIGKVYPNNHLSGSPEQQSNTGSPFVRSYTIFVPRSTATLPEFYSSYEFVPEVRKYLLQNNFRAENLGKWKIPSFVPEDTAFNWFEGLTVYCMSMGIFVPPYGSFEYGNPLGKMWYLVCKNIPYAKDTLHAWSNALYTLLSEAYNASPCLLSFTKPSKTELKAIFLRNNGNGYKVLYEIMQHHATHLNMGSSSRVRNDGPPRFGKNKTVEEYAARYREYWIQRYYYSGNRTVCQSPELQLTFLERLPRDVRDAFNMYYWRPEYDDPTTEIWYYNTLPNPLRFDRITEFISIACDRRSVNLDELLARPRGTVFATRGADSDAMDSDEEDFIPGISATSGATLVPLGTCPFCPDYQGRHDLNSCTSLARIFAGMQCLQSNPALRSHLERLYPGHLKRLPPPPPRAQNSARDRPRSNRTSGSANGKPGGSRRTSSSKPRVAQTQGDASVVSGPAEVDSGDDAPADEQDRQVEQTCCLHGEVDDIPYDDAFGLFTALTDDDSGCIQAVSNAPFPRFSVEDAIDSLDADEFPVLDLDGRSVDDLECLLHPMDEISFSDASVSMTRAILHSTRGRRSPPPWKSSLLRHTFAHMDHGANLSVVYDHRLLHHYVEKQGLVIRDVGGNRHPTLGYGFICLHAASHQAPIYLPAYYCPSLASNIISPQQAARYFHASRSSTVLDTQRRIGCMHIHDPPGAEDILVEGVIYDSLLWAGPLLMPPRDGKPDRIVQPWAAVRVSMGDPVPVIPGSGEAGDSYVVEMAITRAARARTEVPPSSPVAYDAVAAAAEEASIRAEYEAAMANIARLLSPHPEPVSASPPATPAPALPPPAPAPVPISVATPVPPGAGEAEVSVAAPVPPGTGEAEVVHASLRSETAHPRRLFLRTLLHQRLGHLHQRRLSDLSRFVDGVPKVPFSDPALCTCPICLAAKMRRLPAGNTPTRQATQLYEGLSLDLGFVVQRPDLQKLSSSASSSPPVMPFAPISADQFKRLSALGKYKYQLGLRGEMGYLIIQDHHSGALFGTTLLSKTPPIDYLRSFLERHRCSSPHRYVRMDHGGDLGGSRRVLDLFSAFGYSVQLTAPDTPHQNGLIERVNQDIGNYLRAALSGASLTPTFWPYAFRHFLRLYNSLPHRRRLPDGTTELTRTPFEVITGQRPNLAALRTFGCRVWTRPPGGTEKKTIPTARAGRFLGFTRSMHIAEYVDEATKEIKESSNLRFDEVFMDVLNPPPNAVVLRAIANGVPPSTDEFDIIPPQSLEVSFHPSLAPVAVDLPPVCDHETLGLLVAHDRDRDRAYLAGIVPNSSAARARLHKYVGAYFLRISGSSVQHADDVLKAIRAIDREKGDAIALILDPEPIDTARRREPAQVRLTSEQLAAIHAVRHTLPRSNDYDQHHADFIRFYDEMCSGCCIHSLGAASLGTDAERHLKKLTRNRLKQLPTWHLWQRGSKGEFAQLDAMAKQGMYGDPVDLPPGGILLRQHWTYIFKSDGTRKARNCCDGSKRAAPVLHGEAKTYASCIEQPCMRVFFALCATHSMVVYGADATNAFANSPPPSLPTFVNIDDAYFEWYRARHGKDLDRRQVLPVLHALQGHPESGHLWERLIDDLLCGLGLTSTTHERNLYRGFVEGSDVLLCRQVDDLAIGTCSPVAYDYITDAIGKRIELTKLGLLERFNGVDIRQTREYIQISCSTYIEQMLSIHGCLKPKQGEDGDKPIEPLPQSMVDEMQNSTGPAEGTPAHKQLEKQMTFNYRNAVGELVWVFIVARIDLAFAAAFLTRFSSAPAAVHYRACTRIMTYLRMTKDWGLVYWRPTPLEHLPPGTLKLYVDPQPRDLSRFPAYSDPTALVAFADAAHATDLKRRRSVSGFCCVLAGAAVAYKSKLQPVIATSSTEAEFVCAVQAAKTVKYLRTILKELHVEQTGPTIIYEDNMAAIAMVNSAKPTPRSRHIDTQYYAIQHWKERRIVALSHIPGVLCPADALTKPLARILHHRHSRRLMGHYGPPAYASYAYPAAS
jgi:Reverse transcriptase (RNA-dependent DNA polymerase)